MYSKYNNCSQVNKSNVRLAPSTFPPKIIKTMNFVPDREEPFDSLKNDELTGLLAYSVARLCSKENPRGILEELRRVICICNSSSVRRCIKEVINNAPAECHEKQRDLLYSRALL